MNWDSLLDTTRHGDQGYAERPERPIHTQDADRVTFSASFRRLANKTQVHPLYNNDHLRHRMIHSSEVASVGRTLGMQIGHWLGKEGHIAPEDKYKVAGVVHAASLAHDIGNPPFGHSGEASIGAWFKEKFQVPEGVFRGIDRSKWAEFEMFEGNAQGFRILTHLEMYRGEGGMRLSNAVLGAFTKYPMTAAIQTQLAGDPYVGAKKFGVFEAEYEIFAQVAQSLGLAAQTAPDGQTWWRRHPLVYLVEAADDICYNIVDLEDGYTSGDLSLEQAEDLLTPLGGVSNRDLSAYTGYERIAYLRARSIGAAVSACVEAFQKNHGDILSGAFSGSLIEVSDKAQEFGAIKKAAREQLFEAPRKTKLEVRGRNVIHRVLDGIVPVYHALEAAQWCEENLPDYERQLTRAAGLDLRDITDSYSALHAMADYVSGMTDRYAVEVANMVSGT